MSTITKERVAQFIKNPLDNGLTRGEQMELARIALASLEAVPVAYADPQAFRNFQAGVARREWMWRNPGEDLIAVYTAPPTPVSVPEWTNEQCLEFLSIAFRHAEIKGDLELDDIRLGVKMVNGSRAAMLHGADGNSPVIADGWVACSERMPETMVSVLVTGTWFHHAVAFWDGLSWCDLDFEPPVTHWIPLPAAPQQEAE